jgi:hypothetical protein
VKTSPEFIPLAEALGEARAAGEIPDDSFESLGELIAHGERATPKPTAPVKPKTLAEFVNEFSPIAFRIEPTVRSASVYALTAKTGSGKTGLLTITALAVATGRADIIGMEVEKCRVVYCAFENPDDVRMRLMVACFQLTIDAAEVLDDILIIDLRSSPEALIETLKAHGKDRPFGLVIIDTYAAAFDGKDINDNVQAGEFVRRLRPISQLPGLPSVIIAAHPVKGAAPDNLIPYGGGAILNELDGNLVLKKDPASGLVELHWQGKFRGLEFKPKFFRFDIVSSPDVIDKKGNQIALPILRPATEEDAEQREAASVNSDMAVLRAMAADEKASIRDLAAKIGVHRSKVERTLQRFEKAKLAENIVGKWSLTSKGRKASDGGDND